MPCMDWERRREDVLGVGGVPLPDHVQLEDLFDGVWQYRHSQHVDSVSHVAAAQMQQREESSDEPWGSIVRSHVRVSSARSADSPNEGSMKRYQQGHTCSIWATSRASKKLEHMANEMEATSRRVKSTARVMFCVMFRAATDLAGSAGAG